MKSHWQNISLPCDETRKQLLMGHTVFLWSADA